MERNEKGQFVKYSGVVDLTGHRFGKLTVIKLDKERTKRKSYWICRCDCGNVKSIRGDTLIVINSCGCIKKEQDIKNLGIKRNHNMTHHRLFPVWNSMMNRCNNPKSRAYKDYGGRGIQVCDEWKYVENFIKWAENNGYIEGYTIERIDVNGNYCPDNCCWIPANQQTWNTRKTVYIQIENEKIPIAKRARELGLSPCLVWHRWNSGIRDYEKLFYKGNLCKKSKG